MPFVTQAYLNYLEQQMSGGGAGAGGAGLDPGSSAPPPADFADPFASNLPPGQGGPGSYPAGGPPPVESGYPSPVTGGTPIGMTTPDQWGPGTGVVPMPGSYPSPSPTPGGGPGPINDQVPLPTQEPAPSPPPYVYNDPYGTGDPNNVNIPYPGDITQGPPMGYPPATDAPPMPPGMGDMPQPPGVPDLGSHVGDFLTNLGNFFTNIFSSDPTPGIAPSGSPVGSYTPDAVASGIPIPGGTAGLGSFDAGNLGNFGSVIGNEILRHAMRFGILPPYSTDPNQTMAGYSGATPQTWDWWRQRGLVNPTGAPAGGGTGGGRLPGGGEPGGRAATNPT